MEGYKPGELTVEEKEKRLKQLQALGQQFSDRSYSINYIPLKFLAEIMRDIPSGAIVNIIRENRPNMPVLVSHQGFAIRKDEALLFRHATFPKEPGSVENKVLDSPFLEYFKLYENAPWKALGIHLLEVLPKKIS